MWRHGEGTPRSTLFQQPEARGPQGHLWGELLVWEGGKFWPGLTCFTWPDMCISKYPTGQAGSKLSEHPATQSCYHPSRGGAWAQREWAGVV